MSYPVFLCLTCHHPGGQHRHVSGLDSPAPCVLCDCPDYDPEDVKSSWNDDLTERALAEYSRSSK